MHLRMLLMQGAKSVVRNAHLHDDPISKWAHQPKEKSAGDGRGACRGQRPQTRRISPVGLNRRPEPVLVGGIEVCKLCARMHAQIMTGDLPRGLVCIFDFASIARPNECAARPRAIQARPYRCPARTRKARHLLARCSTFGFQPAWLLTTQSNQVAANWLIATLRGGI